MLAPLSSHMPTVTDRSAALIRQLPWHLMPRIVTRPEIGTTRCAIKLRQHWTRLRLRSLRRDGGLTA